ncbi:MAG TPA: hypothetical protein VHC86_11505 [Opitutaceae bacterium]|nr:hypothetical protein [Opitutaceae bacterium]
MATAGGERARWVAASAAAAAAVLASLALFRLPPPPARAPAGPKPTLGLAALDPALREQTELNDPRPLFLPTEWNAAPHPSRPDPAATFRDYAARTVFPASDLASPLPWPPFAVPRDPAEALALDPPGNPYAGIGRRDGPAPALAPRGAHIEVTSAATGRVVLARAVDARPPESGTPFALEFSASVDAAGLVGPVVLEPLESPDAPDAVTAFFRDYLERIFWLGNRLPPGSYRIRVGP